MKNRLLPLLALSAFMVACTHGKIQVVVSPASATVQVGTDEQFMAVVTGATVVVIAPHATGMVQAWASAGKLKWQAREFEPSDLDGVFSGRGCDIAAGAKPACL